MGSEVLEWGVLEVWRLCFYRMWKVLGLGFNYRMWKALEVEYSV